MNRTARNTTRLLVLLGCVFLLAAGLFVLIRDRIPPNQGEVSESQGDSPADGQRLARSPNLEQNTATLPDPEIPANAAPQEIAEIEEFIGTYHSLTEGDEKVSHLMDVRMLELEDYAPVYTMLIAETLGSDPEVRDAARDALREYGGPHTAEALRLLLETDSQIPERGELEKTLEFIRLPSVDLQGRTK